ncbi:CDP-diglyceride synthetase [Paucilactobacillus hokkaidonensis JCM 18461]|uniref:Phosphatidate cytidylyltransferase n=2 Tax=Paucilactobacillus hokkaidonensis TaxID=1193095 RepID=A0A0A1GXU2_9LACO|nr:phosphatidate cytidylyltransferase [Paucilactobacillus hokkaidonensis]KRO10288.1 phosphatidate cytidylyltransferase [Paucilactobacillus hokkaidonensis]BAP85743.1 CDP-diglyceride synthetase [Paucilactobacillus hokkaidonensis JCM 18461]
MKQRVITAVVALAIFIPLIVYGGLPLTIAALLLGIIALDEILIMKKMLLVSFEAIVSNLGVILLILPDNWLNFLPDGLNRMFLFYVLVVLILLHTVIRKARFTFDDAGVLTLAMLYIGMGFHYFVTARADSLVTLLYAMLIVWLTDSGAYMLGKQFGKHKLSPKISPNKTWEGSVGGTIAATVILAVYLWFFPVQYGWIVMILVTFILSIFGQFGDLIESSLKRFYGVKDSGKILPGHGGILDRFDSMLIVMPMLHLLGIV